MFDCGIGGRVTCSDFGFAFKKTVLFLSEMEIIETIFFTFK